MKISCGIITLCFIGFIGVSNAEFCDDYSLTKFPESVCYVETCSTAIKEHIKEELKASFSYMYLAARFDDVTVDRQGIAKFLYESASEERHHAILMLDYLNKRGIDFDQDFKFDITNIPLVQSLITDELTYKGALETALKLEIDVTQMIYNVVKQCDTDFHGADFFTDPILAEQHEGIRKLQGAIKTYEDLVNGHGDSPAEIALVEYLFDGKMLSGVF